MKSVGIDIGSSSIKIIEVSDTNKGLLVTSFKEHPLNPNPDLSLGVSSDFEVIEYLKSLALNYNPEQWRIVLGLPQGQVAVRNKIFPFNDRLKILKSLPFELEEDLPFSPENAIYDAKIVKTIGSSAEVLACATPKLRVADLVQKIQNSGLGVSIISAEGLAFANCFEKWNEAPPHQPMATLTEELSQSSGEEREIQIIVNIGHTRTLVSAFEDRKLIGVRSIMWGGNNLVLSIAKKYEIPYIEALSVLQSRAFILLNQDNANYDQIVFSQVITDSLKELTRDLQMTFLEFRSELRTRITSLGLTGGVSNIQNIHTFFTQQLEISSNPVQILSGSFTYNFVVDQQLDSRCGVALGLAIEGLKKPRNPALNLLKGEFQRQNKKLKIFWDKWGKSAQVGAAIFVVFMIYSTVREQFSSTLIEKTDEIIKTQAKNIAKLPTKQANESGLRKFITEKHKKAQDIKSIQSLLKMNSALDILRKISDAVPTKNNVTLTVKKVSIFYNRVEVEGSVAKPQELISLQSALGQLSTTGKVDVLKSSEITGPNTPFSFGFFVDRGMVVK